MRQMTRFAARTAAALALTGVGTLAWGALAGGTVGAEPARPDHDPHNAPAATSTVTLPLLGAPVLIDVTTDAGGGLVDVTLSAANTRSSGQVHVNHVSFVNEDGSVKLRVAAAWGSERVSARVGTLTDISGPGGWTGDVFGTGETTDVTFTVGATDTGTPDILDVTVTSPHEHAISEVDRAADGARHSAKVTIEFRDQGQRRWLTIDASAPDEPGHGRANVTITLSHPWGPLLTEGAPVGAHTWSGTLCDGTTATITYVVAADGRITDVSATPAADVRSMGTSVWVAFERFQGVTLFSHDRGEGLRVGAIDKLHCPPAAPTVNGADAGDERRNGRDDHAGGRPGRAGDWGDGGNDHGVARPRGDRDGPGRPDNPGGHSDRTGPNDTRDHDARRPHGDGSGNHDDDHRGARGDGDHRERNGRGGDGRRGVGDHGRPGGGDD